MKSRILIPLDGSSFSRKVINHVVKIFPPSICEIVLLKVSSVPDELKESLKGSRVTGDWATVMSWNPAIGAKQKMDPDKSAYIERVWGGLKAEMVDNLAEIKEKLKEDGYDVTLGIRFGNVAKEIISYTELNKIDLIAMSTHGRKGFKRMIIGSVAEKVLPNVRIPVMMLHP